MFIERGVVSMRAKPARPNLVSLKLRVKAMAKTGENTSHVARRFPMVVKETLGVLDSWSRARHGCGRCM